jgi:hypothetical protein
LAIWKTDVAYRLGQIDDAKVSEQLLTSIGLIAFKYGQPPQQSPTEQRGRPHDAQAQQAI